jgi:hypothetical protein
LPKAKPTSINVHRIEAGEWERQNILRPVADIAKITKSVQAGAVTIVCVGVGLAGYSAYWFLKKVGGWSHDAEKFVGGLAGFLQNEKGVSEEDAKTLKRSGIGQPLDNVPLLGPILRLFG